jgi:hypothetical protein
LRLFSLDLIVIGIVDEAAFNSIIDLDQEQITPLSYGVPAWNVHPPLSQTIILPFEIVMSLAGLNGRGNLRFTCLLV